jgi:hypothetical protein
MEKKLPIYCIRKIQEYGDTFDQFSLSACNKYFIKYVPITDIIRLSEMKCNSFLSKYTYKLQRVKLLGSRHYTNKEIPDFIISLINQYNIIELEQLIVKYFVENADLLKKIKPKHLKIAGIMQEYNYNHMNPTILDLCDNITDKRIFNNFTNIKELYLYNDLGMVGKFITMNNLTHLSVNKCHSLSNNDIKHLPLKMLNLNFDGYTKWEITPELFQQFHLEELYIRGIHYMISDNHIKPLVFIKKLHISCKNDITDDAICDKKLEELSISRNKYLTNRCIENINPYLQRLSICETTNITLQGIKKLKNLTYLKIAYCDNFSTHDINYVYNRCVQWRMKIINTHNTKIELHNNKLIIWD